MKTKINKFWNTFLSIQIDLINAYNVGNLTYRDQLLNELYYKATKIHPKLMLFVYHFPIQTNSAILIFITKGDYKLKAIVEELVVQAPELELWQYQIGIKPYKHSIVSLCANIKFLPATVFQIYFAIKKVYKTSNKLHLLIYMEIDKRHSKYDLHDAMISIFHWFLGDELYYKHISRFKIIRRKYSAIRFIPLDELKNTIQFKNLN